MKLSDLAQTAMLGTERQPLPVPSGGGQIARLLSQLKSTEPESTLLSAAALCSQYEIAGALPPRESTALESPCSPEANAPISETAASLVRRLLDGEHAALWNEALALMRQAKLIVLPDLLPRLLETGTKRPELGEAILPVLGERGVWLAAQNANWSWVTAEELDDELWLTGPAPARLGLLRHLRRATPERAVELLESSWKDETPDDRRIFVTELASGLCESDEPFLEGALGDKRKEVRQAAAKLLARLPRSAFSQRMLERVRPSLTFTPRQPAAALKLKRAQPATLEVTLPTVCDATMQRDGIELRPPAGTGEKAWWLIQLLEAVPLETWTARWSATPVEILAASQAGEWKEDLFEAWTRAAIRQADAAWADALFQSALECGRPGVPTGLLSVLTADQREAKLTALLTENDAKTRELHGVLLNECRHHWSPGFSRVVLAYFRKETARESFDWQWRNQLKDWAVHVSPAVFAEAATGWDTESKGWEFWSKGVDEFLAAIQFRADLHRAFSKTPHRYESPPPTR